MRLIRCDCGFEAAEEDEAQLVTRAQEHARHAHGVDLPAELVLALAGSTVPPAAPDGSAPPGNRTPHDP